jgi:hypothetical protein
VTWIREGFEIGCHSMTHAYLSDIAEPELKREIVDAKNKIEQLLGHAIDHFSCPGGRYDKRALDTARRAGFRTVANSDFHSNSACHQRVRTGADRHDAGSPNRRSFPQSAEALACGKKGFNTALAGASSEFWAIVPMIGCGPRCSDNSSRNPSQLLFCLASRFEVRPLRFFTQK